jgi:D-glycero-D-manno-heptose 1,7-bisphosphate phosphatase
MSIKTIFLDRDGVINKDLNYLYKIDNFKFINGVFHACNYLQNIGYKIIVVTNQSGISRGYYSETDYLVLCKWMVSKFRENGIEILNVFHCPHSPDESCNCRKPKPGMLLNAKVKYNVDMQNSWMVGDRENDIKAANEAGIQNTILVRSGHNIDERNSNAVHIIDSIKDINQVIKK